MLRLASESWDRNNEQYTTGIRRLASENAIVLMLESKRVPEFEDVSKLLIKENFFKHFSIIYL